MNGGDVLSESGWGGRDGGGLGNARGCGVPGGTWAGAAGASPESRFRESRLERGAGL